MATSYVYAVLRTQKELDSTVGELALRGMDAKVTTFSGQNVLIRPALNPDPYKKQILAFGGGGAFIGGISAAIASPHLPGAEYQILTPLMAMIVGAVFFAYFGVWTWGFLNGLDIVEEQAGETFQTNGETAWAVAIQTQNMEKKVAALQCLEENGAVCVVIRESDIGPLELIAVENDRDVLEAKAIEAIDAQPISVVQLAS